MRVTGNAIPDAVSVWAYPKKPGMAEIRLRENVQEQTYTDRDTGGDTTVYAYNEYTLYIPYYSGLEADIKENLASWLETARDLETSPQASAIVDAQEQMDSLVDAMAAMVEDIYTSDTETIGG